MNQSRAMHERVSIVGCASALVALSLTLLASDSARRRRRRKLLAIGPILKLRGRALATGLVYPDPAVLLRWQFEHDQEFSARRFSQPRP
jgi:hypothetical protein